MSHDTSVIRGTRLLVSAKSSLQPNPAEAAELAMQHATEVARADLLEQVGRLWPDIEAPAASVWLDHLEAGPERDAAVGGFVRELFETNPKASLVWRASPSDEGKRSRVSWNSTSAGGRRSPKPRGIGAKPLRIYRKKPEPNWRRKSLEQFDFGRVLEIRRAGICGGARGIPCPED